MRPAAEVTLPGDLSKERGSWILRPQKHSCVAGNRITTKRESMTKRMVWVVSPTKLCNLRCSYCYEWNELGNPAKMSPELLRCIFTAVRAYHLDLETKFSRVVSNISWLGGEPLILPLSYLEQIQSLEHELLGDLVARGAFYNVVQSNLYRLNGPVIDFLERHKWKVGISLDVVPGVRVSVNGRETEQRVLENAKRLRARGIQSDAIVVLAKHTVPSVLRIYDLFVDQGFSKVRFLPLFSGPPERPVGSVVTSDEELADALCRLFVHWIESGMKAQVEPIQEYLHNILRKMVGLRGQLYDRAEHGEGVLVVNTNGDLYQLLDTYLPDRAMGNLGREPIAEILKSPVSQWTLSRDASLRASMCGPCEHAGTCNGTPAIESPREGYEGGRCQVAHTVHSFIENYLRKMGVDTATLMAMQNDMSRASSEGVA